MDEMLTGLAEPTAAERTYDGNAKRRRDFRLILDPGVERLCGLYAEVARAVIMRRIDRQEKAQ